MFLLISNLFNFWLWIFDVEIWTCFVALTTLAFVPFARRVCSITIKIDIFRSIFICSFYAILCCSALTALAFVPFACQVYLDEALFFKNKFWMLFLKTNLVFEWLFNTCKKFTRPCNHRKSEIQFFYTFSNRLFLIHHKIVNFFFFFVFCFKVQISYIK